MTNSSSLDVYPPSQLAQTTGESDAFGGDYKLDNSEQCGAVWPTENSLPALVLDSPECSTLNQMDMSKASSSTLDAWGEIDTRDNYWKDILEYL